MEDKILTDGAHLIHGFMGDECRSFVYRYVQDWNYLMEVIEKIESIHDDFHGYFGVYISGNTCTIQGTKLDSRPESFHPAYLSDPNAIFPTKIESTWYAVVSFIKWYNENLKK